MTKRAYSFACLLALMLLLVALPAAAQDDAGTLDYWFHRLMEMATGAAEHTHESTETETTHEHGETATSTHDHSSTDTSEDTSADVTSSVDMSAFAGLEMTRTEDGAFLLGDPDAPVTIIEFADFGCPHCQNYKTTIDQFIDEYVRTGQANFEFRTFPTAGGQLTVLAGSIAECADNQIPGAFWLAHEYFYKLASAGRYNEDMGRLFAEEYGLDYDALLSCAVEAQQVFTDVEFGREMGISGTPGVLVRFNGGEAQQIVVDDQVYDRGGVPIEILARVVTEGIGEAA